MENRPDFGAKDPEFEPALGGLTSMSAELPFSCGNNMMCHLNSRNAFILLGLSVPAGAHRFTATPCATGVARFLLS